MLIMIILLVLAIVFGMCTYKGWVDIWAVILLIVVLFCLVVGVFIKMINSIEVKAKIHEFEATRMTIERARLNGINLEDTAIQLKVIESNQWLANQQYYNSIILGWWVPDEIDDLKPIE